MAFVVAVPEKKKEELLSPLHQVGPQGRRDHHAGGERAAHQAVGERALLLVGDVGHVREHHAEGDGEHAGNTDHGEEPEGVDGHEGDGQAGEEHGDEQEQLPAADVGEGAHQGGAEEGEDALDAHDEAVHEERVVREGVVQHGDDGHREQAPREELQEDDHQGVVEAGLADAGGLRHEKQTLFIRIHFYSIGD